MKARAKKCFFYESLYYVQVKKGLFWKDWQTDNLEFLIKIANEYYSPLEVRKKSILFVNKEACEDFIDKYLNASSNH